MNDFQSIEFNTSLQSYKGVPLRLIPRQDYHAHDAKRYVINDTNQNLWIPNKHLSSDGTIREGHDLDYIMEKAWNQIRIGMSGPAHVIVGAPVFKVVIAGGRDFVDIGLMLEYMDRCLQGKLDHNIRIISGTARGADRTGEIYASARGHKVIHMPAQWDTYGKSAGYRRNVEMAEAADAVICFWDGKSKGTKHMIDIAKERGLPLRVCRY